MYTPEQRTPGNSMLAMIDANMKGGSSHIRNGKTASSDNGNLGGKQGMQRKQRWSFVSIVVMLSIVLAACGNGSGTGGASSSASGGATAASPSASGTTNGASPSASGGATAASPSASGGATAASPSASGTTATTPAMGDATATAGAGAAGGATTACPDTAQGAQVAMWSPLTGPDGNVMTQLTARFNQENAQGIQVQHVPQPEYIEKLTTAAAGNDLPEMTIIRASDTAEMAERNVVQPIGDEALTIIGGTNLAAEFPEATWTGGEYQGERYAIPLDVHPLVLYYNKDLFQQAGITMPTDRPMTREEFEAAAEALTKDGVTGVAVGTLDVLFETILEQFGGTVVNEDGTEATFNSPEGVEALTYLRDLRQKYSPNTGGEGDPELTLFLQGKAAMVIHGPWNIPNLGKVASTGVAMAPQLGDTMAVWGNSHQLALTTDDPARQAAAACWIGWLSENSALWATAGMIPARESVRTSEEISTVAPVMNSFSEEAEYAVLLPSVPGIGSAVRAEGYVRAVNEVLLNQQTDVKAALDQAAQRSNQLLEQNRQTYGGS